MVYDFISTAGPELPCSKIPTRVPHAVSLRFKKPGDGLIRVWGRRVGPDTPTLGVPTVLEYRVAVGTAEGVQSAGGGASGAQWVVGESGAGPVRIGMTVEEAIQAAGRLLNAGEPPAPCYYLRPEGGPSGVAFMVVNGRIARVDVNTRSLVTDLGARVGDSEERIKTLYPRVQTAPLKNTAGHYLTALPEGDYRIVFETDGSNVTRYRAGRMPEVAWPNGCQ
jgi:hypothetical protein